MLRGASTRIGTTRPCRGASRDVFGVVPISTSSSLCWRYNFAALSISSVFGNQVAGLSQLHAPRLLLIHFRFAAFRASVGRHHGGIERADFAPKFGQLTRHIVEIAAGSADPEILLTVSPISVCRLRNSVAACSNSFWALQKLVGTLVADQFVVGDRGP